MGDRLAAPLVLGRRSVPSRHGLIAKYQRRFPDFDDKIISMFARGMTVREIVGLEELYGIEVSPDLISTVTDAVLQAVAEWQGRRSTAAIRWSFSTRSG